MYLFSPGMFGEVRGALDERGAETRKGRVSWQERRTPEGPRISRGCSTARKLESGSANRALDQGEGEASRRMPPPAAESPGGEGRSETFWKDWKPSTRTHRAGGDQDRKAGQVDGGWHGSCS